MEDVFRLKNIKIHRFEKIHQELHPIGALKRWPVREVDVAPASCGSEIRFTGYEGDRIRQSSTSSQRGNTTAGHCGYPVILAHTSVPVGGISMLSTRHTSQLPA